MFSQTMLTQQLRKLERDGFIKREMFSEMPVRVEYSLTALGGKLRPVLRVLDAWSRKYVVEKEPSLTRVTKRVGESNPGTLPNYDRVVAIALIISVRSLSEIKVNTSAWESGINRPRSPYRRSRLSREHCDFARLQKSLLCNSNG
jgi:hypothetical protein